MPAVVFAYAPPPLFFSMGHGVLSLLPLLLSLHSSVSGSLCLCLHGVLPLSLIPAACALRSWDPALLCLDLVTQTREEQICHQGESTSLQLLLWSWRPSLSFSQLFFAICIDVNLEQNFFIILIQYFVYCRLMWSAFWLNTFFLPSCAAYRFQDISCYCVIQSIFSVVMIGCIQSLVTEIFCFKYL